MFDNDVIALLPEIFLINATIVLLLFGVVYSTSKRLNYPTLVRNVAWLGFWSLMLTLILVVTKPLNTATLCYNNLLHRR